MYARFTTSVGIYTALAIRSEGWSSSALACSNCTTPNTGVMWNGVGPVPDVGSTLYVGSVNNGVPSSTSTVFNGGGLWRCLYTTGWSILVNASGVVTSKVSCSTESPVGCTAWLSPSSVTQTTTTAPDWVNITNIYALGNVTSVSLPSSGQSEKIIPYNYGITLPGAAVISGIQVELYVYSTLDGINSMTAQLMNGTTPIGNPRTLDLAWPILGTTINLGSTTDLWGTINPPVTTSSFGVSIVATNGATAQSAQIEYVKIKVCYGYDEDEWYYY